jgi:hypothetical protein
VTARTTRALCLFPLVLLLLGGAAPSASYEALSTIAPVPRVAPPGDQIRGITLAPIEDQRLGEVGYGSARCAEAIRELAGLSAGWISITPFGRMDDLDSTDVLPDFEIPLSLNEELIRRTVRQARAAGLQVAIIPHVYVMSGRWRGRIDPGDEAAWAAWFASYERFVLSWAELAEEVNAELFSIGVEFGSSTNFRPAAWRRLIARVRQVYGGALTYSANWDEADQVPFWDDLDLIGINGFWPLASAPGDQFETMGLRAAAVAAELEALAYHWFKPVLLTEVGVKSARDSALAPWEWPEHCDRLEYDEEYQAAAYQAWFEALAGEPWFAGLFVWKYIVDPYDETQEAPEGFSLRDKQGELVLARWFSRSWDRTALDLWPE